MKIAQEKQQLKTKNITQINGCVPTTQIKQKLRVEESVNMEIEASNFYYLQRFVDICSFNKNKIIWKK